MGKDYRTKPFSKDVHFFIILEYLFAYTHLIILTIFPIGLIRKEFADK